jgi:hypothetical protein
MNPTAPNRFFKRLRCRAASRRVQPARPSVARLSFGVQKSPSGSDLARNSVNAVRARALQVRLGSGCVPPRTPAQAAPILLSNAGAVSMRMHPGDKSAHGRSVAHSPALWIGSLTEQSRGLLARSMQVRSLPDPLPMGYCRPMCRVGAAARGSISAPRGTVFGGAAC